MTNLDIMLYIILKIFFIFKLCVCVCVYVWVQVLSTRRGHWIPFELFTGASKLPDIAARTELRSSPRAANALTHRAISLAFMFS